MTENEQQNLCSALRVLEMESARQSKLFEEARPEGNYYLPYKRIQSLEGAAFTIRGILSDKLTDDAKRVEEKRA